MNSNIVRTSIAVDGQQQSLMTAINRFVQAVDSMDDTVMIPCRLRDIPLETVVAPTVDMDEEENNNKAVISTQISPKGDLYHFYAMLQAIRSEIVDGQLLNREESSNDNEKDDKVGGDNDPSSEHARKTAAAFRFHLRGLFGLLHQMTETAKYLGSRYEREVSSTQSGISSVSSFKM